MILDKMKLKMIESLFDYYWYLDTGNTDKIRGFECFEMDMGDEATINNL